MILDIAFRSRSNIKQHVQGKRKMYFDLNVPLPASLFASSSSSSTEGKGKKSKKDKSQQQHQQQHQPSQAASQSNQQDPLQRLSPVQRDELKSRVEDLKRMGYSTIAFNHIVTSHLDPSIHRNPFERAEEEILTASTSASTSAQILIPSPSRPIFTSPTLSSLTQLQRLTLILDAASEGKNGMASGLGPGASMACLRTYDLLAVRPLTSNTFNAVCLSHTELKPTGPSFDIISLDLAASPRLPFYLKRTTVGKALENGAVFEVSYSDALPAYSSGSAQQQETRLRNLVSNVRDLLRVTNGGKGIIFSSAAASVLGLRSPTDVMNLATVFGCSPQLARDALTHTCRALCKRAETRRSYRAVAGQPVIVKADSSNTQQGKASHEANKDQPPPPAPAPAPATDPRPRPPTQPVQPPPPPQSKKRTLDQTSNKTSNKKQKKQNKNQSS